LLEDPLIADVDKLVRILHRERSQHDAIDQREDRRVRADAHGKRQGGRDGEPWRLPQQPQGIAHILDEALEGRQAVRVTILFLHRLDRAEFEDGLPPCLARIHAGADVLSRLEVEVFLDAFPEAVLGAPPVERRLQPHEKPPRRPH
jgi:hypothetical protein